MTGPLESPCDRGVLLAAEADAVCRRKTEPWILAATILGSGMAFLDGSAVNVALPVLQSDLEASVSGVQWVVEAYALFLAALILLGGALGDRLGRRRVFAAGIALFAAASAWCGLAPGVGQLVAARALQGLGAALLIPSSLAVIGASFAPERRGRAIGTWSAFSAMTMALGPVLGGWLVEAVSWRAVFFINLPLAAAVLAILYARVPESRGAQAERLDWTGSILATLGLGGLIFGLIESSHFGMGHPLVIATLAAGAALMAAFIVVEAKSRQPMMPLALYRSRDFSGANLITLLLYGALSAALFFFPFNLVQVQGYGPMQAGLAILPFPVCVFLLSRWSGGLTDRFGGRMPLILGPALAGLGMGLFALPGIGGGSWRVFLAAMALLGVGMGLTAAPLTTVVLGSVSTERTGVASGVNNAVSRVATLLAIAVLGLFMLGSFDAALDARLDRLAPPPDLRRTLDAQRTELAAVKLPADLDPEIAASIREAIDESFVTGFKWVMLICAGLGLASAVSAGVLISGKGEAQAEAAPASGE